MCYKCEKRDHLQTFCCKSSITPTAAPDKAVKQVMSNDDSNSLDQLLKRKGDDGTDVVDLWTITGRVTQGYHVHLKVNHKPVQMELDTGATVSVVRTAVEEYDKW